MRVWWWLFPGPWLMFGAWWLVRDASAATTASHESVASNLSHRIFLATGPLMLVVAQRTGLGPLSHHLWPPSLAVTLVGLVFSVGGLTFAI
jgi:hypothetical protein